MWDTIETYQRTGHDPYGLRPQQKETYLESATHNIFDLLDAPNNIVRSGVGFAQTGDPEYLKNILKVVTPLWESRTVPAEELTGSKNWFYNTVVDFATDPTLLFLGGVGKFTKLGETANRIKNLKHVAKIQKNMGDIAELTRTVESIAELKKIIPAGTITKRSLLTLKAPFIPYQVDLGDAKKVTDTFGKFFPKDSFKSLVKQSERLEARIRKGKARDIDVDKLSELEKTLVKTQDEMLDSKGILSIPTALKVDKFIRFFRDKFSTQSAKPFVQTLKDVIGVKKEQQLQKVATEITEASEELKNIGDITDKAFLEKVIQTGEARFISNPATRPDVQKSLKESLDKLQTRTDTNITKLLDADKLGEADKVFDRYFIRAERIKKQAFLRETRLKDAEKIWGESTPELREWVTKHVGSIENLISLENANRVKTQLLESSKGFTSYVPRVLTKEGRELKGKNPKLFFAISRDIHKRISASYSRKLLPESDILQVNKYVRNIHGVDFDFFDTNPIKALLNRKIQSINAIASSQLVQQSAKQFATGSKINAIPIKKFYEKFNLDTKGLQDNLFIPNHVVEDLDRGHKQLFKAFDDSEGFLANVLRINDMYVNQFSRMMLTVGWPAYHHKNATGNIWNNFYAGMGISDLPYYGKAAKLQIRKIKNKLDPDELKLYDEMVAHNIPSGGPLQELDLFLEAGDDSKWTQFLQKPIAQTIESTYNVVNKSKKISLEGKYDPIKIGKAYGKFVENNARIAHYLWAKDKGRTPFEAMKSVNKFLFNYKDLTPFEQQFMRPTFLFYTWMRKNLPLQMRAITQNPKLLAAYNDVTETDEIDLPDYLRASMAIPSPFNPNVIIGGVGVPAEDLNFLNVSDVDPLYSDQISRLLTKVASRFSPSISTPIELLTGQKLYTRKQLHDMGIIEFLTGMTPTSRFARTVKEFSDPKTSLVDKAVDFMTGIRTYTIDPKTAAVATSRRAALGTGKVTKFEVLIPKRKYKEDETTKAIIKHHKKLVAERNKK